MSVHQTTVTVYCAFQEKYEKVYIFYQVEQNALGFVHSNGCESSCCGRDECNKCLLKSAEIFKASFQANRKPL